MGLKYWLLLRQLLTTSRRVSSKVLEQKDAPPKIDQLQRYLLALIHQLQTKLEQNKKAEFATAVSLPVTLYLDEWLMKQYFQNRPNQWALLQTELFQVEHGGTLFYQLLDQHLNQSNPSKFILEVYYFLLKSGFCGVHFNAPKVREEYLIKIEKRLT